MFHTTKTNRPQKCLLRAERTANSDTQFWYAMLRIFYHCAEEIMNQIKSYNRNELFLATRKTCLIIFLQEKINFQLARIYSIATQSFSRTIFLVPHKDVS